MPIRAICPDAGGNLAAALDGMFGWKSPLILCDAGTKHIINDELAEGLRALGRAPAVREYGAGMIIDEAAVGAAVMDVTPATDGIIAVGGGTITDIGRFVASRLGKPFALVMTCPSMDGYASNIAAIVADGRRKIVRDCAYPDAIFGDATVTRAAPAELVSAGFGDMLGKSSSLPDWALSSHMTGEYFCRMTEALAGESLLECVAALPAIVARDERAVMTLSRALLLSGVCMALAGGTRPASGSEHIMSHFMVESALGAGRAASHGATVGACSLISALLYEYLLSERNPDAIKPFEDDIRKYLLPPAKLRELLVTAGIETRPELYLHNGEGVGDMIRACASPGKRYTAARFLSDAGCLGDAIQYALARL